MRKRLFQVIGPLNRGGNYIPRFPEGSGGITTLLSVKIILFFAEVDGNIYALTIGRRRSLF